MPAPFRGLRAPNDRAPRTSPPGADRSSGSQLQRPLPPRGGGLHSLRPQGVRPRGGVFLHEEHFDGRSSGGNAGAAFPGAKGGSLAFPEHPGQRRAGGSRLSEHRPPLENRGRPASGHFGLPPVPDSSLRAPKPSSQPSSRPLLRRDGPPHVPLWKEPRRPSRGPPLRALV